MEKEKALETIGFLEIGVNPFTGELLDKTHLVSTDEIKEALHIAYDSIAKSNYKKTVYENFGKKWTNDEDFILSENFSKGMSVNSLSKLHKRTKDSIISRLIRLGLTNQK